MLYIKRGVLIVSILIVSGVAFSASSQTEAPEVLLKNLINEGELDKAEALADRFENPSGDNLLLLLSELKQRLGNPFEALSYLERLSKKALLPPEVKLQCIKMNLLTYHFNEAYELATSLGEKRKIKPEFVEQAKQLSEIAKRNLLFAENGQLLSVVDSFAVSSINDLRLSSGLPNDVGEFTLGASIKEWNYTTALGYESLQLVTAADGIPHIQYRQLSDTGEVIENRILTELSMPGGEFFPILLQDGETIMFASPAYPIGASNGSDNNSNVSLTSYSDGLGNFDIYTSRKNPETGLYTTPTLLGMPFNSPFDDLLLLYDHIAEVGLLVSNRFAHEGQFNCYLFKLTQHPIPLPTNVYDEKKVFLMLRPWQLSQKSY